MAGFLVTFLLWADDVSALARIFPHFFALGADFSALGADFSAFGADCSAFGMQMQRICQALSLSRERERKACMSGWMRERERGGYRERERERERREEDTQKIHETSPRT